MKLPKWLKAIVGAILILLLVMIVNRWYGQYKAQSQDKKSVPTTQTAPAEGEGSATSKPETDASGGSKAPPKTGEATKDQKTVVVLTDGLNFREDPTQDANVIRGLDKGEKLVLITKQDGWYQVRDAKGTVGWVSASPQYSKVQ